jgi:hypothetical protein
MDDVNKDKTRDEKGKFVPGYCPPTAWKPGECPAGAGRPPNQGSVTYWIKELCAKENGGGQPLAQSVAKKIVTLAKGGNVKAIQEVTDRVDGKVVTPITIDITTATKEIADFITSWLARHSVNGKIEVEESQARQEIANGLLGIVGQAPAVIVVAEE